MPESSAATRSLWQRFDRWMSQPITMQAWQLRALYVGGVLFVVIECAVFLAVKP